MLDCVDSRFSQIKGKSKFNFKLKLYNTAKLGTIVITTFVFVFLPFRDNLKDAFFLLSGGINAEFVYPSPNLQFSVAIL